MKCSECEQDAQYNTMNGIFCHSCLGSHMIENYGYMLDLTEDIEEEDDNSSPE